MIPEEEDEAISSSHPSDGGSQSIVANSQSFSYPRCRAISPKERSLSEPAFTSADLMRWHKILEEGKSIVSTRSNTSAIFTDIWHFLMSSFIICGVILDAISQGRTQTKNRVNNRITSTNKYINWKKYTRTEQNRTLWIT